MKYILSLIICRTNGVIAHTLSISSYETIFFRSLIGGLALSLILMVMKEKLTFLAYKKETLFVILAGISIGLSWTCFFETYQQLGVSIASLFYACGPVILMLLSPIFFKECLTKEKLIGFSIVFLGIVLINGNAMEGQANLFGIITGILSATFYAMIILFNKKATHITGLINTTLLVLSALVVVSVMICLKQGPHLTIMPKNYLTVTILGLVNTGLACYLYFTSMTYLPVQSVAILGYLETLNAIIFSVLFLGELMTPLQTLGCTLVIVGAMICENLVKYPRRLKIKSS